MQLATRRSLTSAANTRANTNAGVGPHFARVRACRANCAHADPPTACKIAANDPVGAEVHAGLRAASWNGRRGTASARTVGSSQSGSRLSVAASSRCSSRSSTTRGDASGRIQGGDRRYIGDASVGPLWCELPGVQLDPPAWRRPVLLRQLIEAGVVGQRDLPSAGARDDPRPLGVVLGHAVAILEHANTRSHNCQVACHQSKPLRASISSIVAQPRLWQRRSTGDPTSSPTSLSGAACSSRLVTSPAGNKRYGVV